MSKRLLSLIFVLLLAAALCACGGEEAKPAPAPAAATETPAAAPSAESAEAPASTEAPASVSEAEDLRPALPDAGLHEAQTSPEEDPEIAARREKALSFVEKDVEALIRELGEPLERNYAPSCLGSGEDGELQYEGFTVYTYREGDRETVKDVS